MARRRSSSVRLFLGLALLAASLVAAPSAPASSLRTDLLSRAHVDPALFRAVLNGPTPALVAYDKDTTSRADLASELEAAGIRGLMFEKVSVGLACVSSAIELGTLSLLPGVRSLYANHELTPALDKSVKAAFNGDPTEVWQDLGVTGKKVGIAILDTGLDATHPDLEFERRTKRNVRVLFSHREALGPNNDPCLPDTYTSTAQDVVGDFTGERPDDLEDTELTSGHGTHMASVAAGDGTASGGKYKGVAPEADLMGVAAIDTITPTLPLHDPFDDREFIRPSLVGAVAGINFVLLNGLEDWQDPMARPVPLVKVVLAGFTIENELYDPWHPLAFSIRDLHDFGISIVFPAGNEGPTVSDCSEADTCRFNPFAADEYAIAVAATNAKASRTALAPYSSRGDPQERPTPEGPVRYEPTLTAPGTGVVAARRLGTASTGQPKAVGDATEVFGGGAKPGGGGETRLDTRMDADYVALTGTSVAAAHVAGAIALMQQAAEEANGCFLREGDVKQILRQTATPMNGYASWEAGAGMIDVAAAVEMAKVWPTSPRPEPWICPK